MKTLLAAALGLASVVTLMRAFAAVSQSNEALSARRLAAPLTVHLVPHSHDDVGWVRTFDEYYSEFVHQIYDNVLACLLRDEKRRFIIVEQAYFSRWFEHLADQQQKQFRSVLSRNQVEFVAGGWVMNDEASVTSVSYVDQMLLGHQYLNKTFGVAPRYGYQIDPFGHSAATPYIMANSGFNAVILNRIHFQEKLTREQLGQLEFVWRTGSTSDNDILAHVLDRHYSSPPNFDFDNDQPIGDDKDLKHRCDRLVEHLMTRSFSYPSRLNFLQLLGDDFRWVKAKTQFENWERVIEYVNERSEEYGMELRFSTLNEYFSALNEEQLMYTIKTNSDFFPYADYETAYWTGYFTSKSLIKRMVRIGENLMRSAEFAAVLWFMGAESKLSDAAETLKDLLTVRAANAELQHHDAVTGTSKSYVDATYFDRIATGNLAAKNVVKQNVERFVGNVSLSATYENLAALRRGEELDVYLFNSLSFEYDELYQLPIYTRYVSVFDEFGSKVSCQVNLQNEADVPDFFPTSPYVLLFPARISPLDASKYTIRYNLHAREGDNPVSSFNAVDKAGEFTFQRNGGGAISFKISPITELPSLVVKIGGAEFDLSPRLVEYTGYHGPGQASGAYIFRPQEEAHHFPLNKRAPIEVSDGPLESQVRVNYKTGSQTFRFRSLKIADTLEFEVENTLGPLTPNSELVMRFTGPNLFDQQCTLKTDASSIFMVDRGNFPVENYAANFFPITEACLLACGNLTIAVGTDRAIGVGIQADTNVDLMLHRRTSKDDGRGVDEPLDDETIVHPHLSFVVGATETVNRDQFAARLSRKYPAVALFGKARQQLEIQVAQPRTSDNVTHNIHSVKLLSVNEELGEIKILVRVETVTAMTVPPKQIEDELLRTVLKTTRKIVARVETTLTGVYPADVERMHWNVVGTAIASGGRFVFQDVDQAFFESPIGDPNDFDSHSFSTFVFTLA